MVKSHSVIHYTGVGIILVGLMIANMPVVAVGLLFVIINFNRGSDEEQEPEG